MIDLAHAQRVEAEVTRLSALLRCPPLKVATTVRELLAERDRLDAEIADLERRIAERAK